MDVVFLGGSRAATDSRTSLPGLPPELEMLRRCLAKAPKRQRGSPWPIFDEIETILTDL